MRTKEQKEIALADLVRLMRRGLNKSEAAKELGVHRTQVVRDWKECLKRLDKDRDHDTLHLRLVYRERYAHVIELALAEYERSRLDKEKRTAESVKTSGKGKGKGSERSKAVSVTEGRLGDAEYLRIVVDCTDKQAELDDAKPPRRIAGPGGDAGDAIPITLVEAVKPDGSA